MITNRVGALFNAQNASPIYFGGGAPRFDNAGTFRKSASTGTTTFGGVAFNNYGTVDIQSGVLAASGGYVSSSNAVLNCALAGTVPGTNYGQLQVSGAVTLNGTLSVNLANNYIPTTNDSFTVLSAGTRNGTFASFSYPSNQVTMQLSNTSTLCRCPRHGGCFAARSAAAVAARDLRLEHGDHLERRLKHNLPAGVQSGPESFQLECPPRRRNRGQQHRQ